VVADAGFAPSGEGEVPATEEGSVRAQIQEAFAQLVEADGQVQFVQNATNGLTTTWNSEAQRLVDGATTPEDMLDAVQSKYEDELGR
jgi:ABC-type glycerol-3-phosphate transport system substrate-binding protein